MKKIELEARECRDREAEREADRRHEVELNRLEQERDASML